MTDIAKLFNCVLCIFLGVGSLEARVAKKDAYKLIQLGDMSLRYPGQMQRTSQFTLKESLPNGDLLLMTLEEGIITDKVTDIPHELRRRAGEAIETSKKLMLERKVQIVDVKEFPVTHNGIDGRNYDIITVVPPNGRRVAQKQIYLLSKSLHFLSVTATAPETETKLMTQRIFDLLKSVKMR